MDKEGSITSKSPGFFAPVSLGAIVEANGMIFLRILRAKWLFTPIFLGLMVVVQSGSGCLLGRCSSGAEEALLKARRTGEKVSFHSDGRIRE